jgi:TP901 family phage tail tape measure protein
MRLLEAATKASVGGVTEVGVASKVLTQIMNAYNISAEETVDLLDAIFVGAQRGSAEFVDLAGSMGNTLQSASQLQVSVPEVVAAIETMVNAGLSADEAATSLNAFFTAVIQASVGSGDAADMARQLGLEFNSTALRTKGLQTFMEDLREAVGNDEVAMQVLSGNVRGFRAAASIAGNGAEFFTETLRAMETQVGALDSAYEKNANTIENQVQLAWNELNAQLTEVGMELLPEVKGAIEEITEVLRENEDQIKEAASALSEILVGGMQAVVEYSPEIIDALTAIANVTANVVKGIGLLMKVAEFLPGFSGVIQTHRAVGRMEEFHRQSVDDISSGTGRAGFWPDK